MNRHHRREFLANVGRGMLISGVGASVAFDLGLASVGASEEKPKLTFGEIEPLVSLLQQTPANKLVTVLINKLNAGTELKTLVAAGALANARTFGGQDYIGYHTFMALGPAWAMSQELPESRRALPVLKVLYRNTARMQDSGGCEHEVLTPIEPSSATAGRNGGELLQTLTHECDVDGAEKAFAAMVAASPKDAYQALQCEIEDEADVHRVVLSWRAWSTLDLVGMEHAHTLLRQSVRYCVDTEKRMLAKKYPKSTIRTQLPKLFDQYKLVGKAIGTRRADDAWIDRFCELIYMTTPEKAADAAAAALAEGISSESVGEAIALAANALVLRDPGRKEAYPDKPVGSVHGDSIGVHASDSANAWRNIARVSNERNTYASLIVAAYHTAQGRHGTKLNTAAYPLPEQLSAVTETDGPALLKALDTAIREKDQFRATAIAVKYGAANLPERAIFDVLLGFAASEDGALHAEKFYRTVSEEFATTRPAFRWRQVAALARVTASEYGKTAVGYQQAKDLLKV
jgi:hypothetical protein